MILRIEYQKDKPDKVSSIQDIRIAKDVSKSILQLELKIIILHYFPC